MKLTIELVPDTSWYNNVRHHVARQEWDVIRRKCYKQANHHCEICGDTGKMECHEVWDYNDIDKSQKLIRFICLCEKCHKVKHAGLAGIRGETELVIAQLIWVNAMSRKEAVKYIEQSFDVWRRRNKVRWKVDISYLSNTTTDE